MATSKSREIASLAEEIYEQRLKSALEKSHPDSFVAIEPVSGEYFLGSTLSEAGANARKAYPGRTSYIMRIGHKAAVRIGMIR